MRYKSSIVRFAFKDLLMLLVLAFLLMLITTIGQAQEVRAFGDNSYQQSSVPASLSGVLSISAGLFHGAALKTDGTVDVWGYGGTADNVVADVIAIAAGGLHTVALKADGTVVVFGDNSFGQFNIPVGLTNVKAIAAGSGHSLALKDNGTVVGWGFGVGSIPDGLSNVVAISAGNSYSMALKADGTVVTWGGVPATLPVGLTDVIAIDAGDSHMLALKADGTVVAWGDNNYNQCTVPPGLANVIAVSAGDNHSVALKADGTVVTWGRNNAGQSSVPPGLANVVEISAGADFTLVRKSDKSRVRVWGSSIMGEPTFDLTGIKQASGGDNFGMALKLNGTIEVWGSGLPAQGASNVKAIASGLFHGVALLANGTVTAWGDNLRGQLDIPPGLANVKEIVAGRYHTIALKADGTIVAWGSNSSGESTVPADVTPAVAIGAGQFHSLAVKADGTAYAWGQSTNSQVPTPAWVPKVKTVSGGSNHSIALLSDGTISFWGGNTNGQGTIPANLFPLRALAGGQVHNLAVRADGTLIDWGAHTSTFLPSGIDDVQFIGTAGPASIAIVADHAPVIANVSSPVQYIEGASAQLLQSTITITDNGHASLAGAMISISNGFVAGDKLAVTTPSGLTQSYDDATGVLSITGSQTVAEFQTMLRSLSYYSTSEAPETNATRTVSITATDGVEAGSPVNFTIDIVPVNDAPSFTKGADITLNEDAGAQTRNGWATGISKGPLDESGQTLTFNVTNDNNSLFSVQPSINASGTLTFTPAANKSGVATVTVSLSDNGGVDNGGVDRSSDQTFVITINPVNDAPTFNVLGSIITDEDYAVPAINFASGISAGAPDEAGQTLTFEVTNDNNSLFSVQPEINSSGRLTFTLTPDASGTALLTIKLIDNGGTANGGVDRTQKTSTIIVRSVNDAPSFTKGANVGINEDAGAQTIAGWATNMSPGPADEAAQTLTFSLSNDNTSLFSAQPSLDAAGNLTYTPALNAYGVATVTVTLTDNGGTTSGGINSVSQTFTITINDVNDAPTFTTGTAIVVWEDMVFPNPSGGWVNSPSHGPSNEAGQTLTVETENNNNSLFSVQPTINLAGQLSFVLAPNANGSATITIRLIDNGGTANGGVDRFERTFPFTVQDVNDAPSFTPGPDISINEDAGTQSINAWATNISPGPANEATQTLTFSVSNNDNAGLFAVQPALTASGNLTFTPATDLSGVANITFTLTDNGGTLRNGVNNVSHTFTITINDVNDGPSFTKGADVVINEDAAAQTIGGWATAISAGPANESSQNVSFDVSNDNTSLFSVQPSVNASGDLTFTPAPNMFGEAIVKLSIIDDGGSLNGGVNQSAEQIFYIEINAINDAPSFIAGSDIDVSEDAGGQTFNGWATNITAGPEESGQTLTLIVTNDNNTLFSQQPSVDLLGNLTFTPASDVSGVSQISVKLRDNGGTAVGGIDEVTETFTITIHSVNDAPSFTKGSDIAISEDAGTQTYSSWATAISAGPADEVTQTVVFDIENDNRDLFSVQPSLNASGTLSFTSAPDKFGIATVTVFLQDNGGTTNGGNDQSATQTFTITIDPVNDPPSFTKGRDVELNEDAGEQTITGWATNITSGFGETQGLTFLVINDNSTLFSVQPEISASGDLTFTPAANISGSAQLTISLRDDGGTANGGTDQSGTQQIEITINPVNDAPSFTKGNDVFIPEDAGMQLINAWATNIAAGPADEASQVLAFVVTNDKNDLFTLQPSIDAQGDLKFTPAPNAGGSASVIVTLTDNGGTANGGSDNSTQTFMIIIENANESPSFTPGANITVLEDAAPYAVPWATNVTAGEGEGSQVVTFEVTTSNKELFSAQPAIDRFGVLSFTLVPNRSGTSTVNVILRDNGGITHGGNDRSSGTSFTITVLPVNDAPGIDQVQDIDVDTNTEPFTITLNGIHAGGDHEVISVEVVSDDPSIVNISETQYTPGSNTATMLLTPSQDQGGVATITIKVKDNGGVENGGIDETIMTFRVNVEEIINAVYIPNLFTPDGNGTNDVFRVRASGVSEVQFRVYDIHGKEVFSTSDVDMAVEAGWDGRYQGKDQPSGTYTWVLTGKYRDGRSLTNSDNRYGQVILMR